MPQLETPITYRATPTTYRVGCGTHLGMVMHQDAGEEVCGECRHGELVRRLEAEAVAVPPPPAWRTPVTRKIAAANRKTLADAIGEETW